MINNLRWRGVMAIFIGFLSSHFLFDYVTLLYRPRNFIFNDPVWNYLVQFFFWTGFVTMITLFMRKLGKQLPLEPPTAEWGLFFIPFYNAILFLMPKSPIKKARNASILFGSFFLFWQISVIFPWFLFHGTEEDFFSQNNHPTFAFTETLFSTIANSGFLVTWVIYVYSIQFGNYEPEQPVLQSTHHRVMIKDLARGMGPDGPAKYIILIPVMIAFSFLATTKVDVIPVQMLWSRDYDYFSFMQDYTDADLYFTLLASICLFISYIAFIVLTFHIFKMLYGLNVGEAPSAGFSVGAWFIPAFSWYWHYAALTSWRKHFEKGAKDLQLHTADLPDKRILRFAALGFLFLLLRPLFLLFWQGYAHTFYQCMDSAFLSKPLVMYLMDVLSLLWSGESMTFIALISLTAYILHVCELSEGLKKAATKKLISMGELNPIGQPIQY